MIALEEFLAKVEGSTFHERCQSICEWLRQVDSRYDWVGIYWLLGSTLRLGPWSGKQPTAHQTIRVSTGVCGAAVRENRTIIVDDVRNDPRYIVCFVDTRAVIVVPIRARGQVIGEIDVDGTQPAAFGEPDREFLEALADHIGERWPGRW